MQGCMSSLHWCYCFNHHRCGVVQVWKLRLYAQLTLVLTICYDQPCNVQVWSAKLYEQLTLVLSSVLHCAGVECKAVRAAWEAHRPHSTGDLLGSGWQLPYLWQ